MLRRLIWAYILIFILISFTRLPTIFSYSQTLLANIDFNSKDFIWASKYANSAYANLLQVSKDNSNILIYNRMTADFYLKFKSFKSIFSELDHSQLSNNQLNTLVQFFKTYNRDLSSLWSSNVQTDISTNVNIFLWLRSEQEWYADLLSIKSWNILPDACVKLSKKWEDASKLYSKVIESDSSFDKTILWDHYNNLQLRIKSLKDICKADNDKKDEKGDDSKDSDNWNKENNKDKSQSWSTNNKDEKSWNTDDKKSVAWQNFTNKWNFQNFWKTADDSWKIANDEERQQLQDYSSKLKEFQRYNQRYLNNWNQDTAWTDPHSLLDRFSQDPMFKDMIPDWDNKKDW